MRGASTSCRALPVAGRPRELEEVPMSIVGGLDIHRKQITFDYVDTETGEVRRGQICPADREHLAKWLARFAGQDAHFALEGCTGWRYVAEEIIAAGLTPHLADPAETAHLRGPKRRAKTDRADARHQRVQRIHAVLFHHGAPHIAGQRLGTAEGAAALQAAAARCSPAGQLQLAIAVQMLAVYDERLHQVRRQLLDQARHLRGAAELTARLYGVGPITGLAITCWLGGAGRFSSARKAVRFAGLDITVYSSDGKRAPGRLSRQGPPVLRWCLYEAGKTHARKDAPDHAYYAQVKERIDGKRAAISEARKIIRQAARILTGLGDDALAAC